MKKSGLLAVAAALSLSTGVFAADVDFDKGIGDVLDIVNARAPQQHGGGIPQPGHPQPGGPGGNHQQPGGSGADHHQPGGPGGDHHQPGGPGHDNHPVPPPQPWHPGPQPQPWHPGPGNNDWDHHDPLPHHTMYECSDWTFKADSPNPLTDKIYFYDGQDRMQSQKVTINVGARDLKPWESEIITVCPGDLTFEKSLFSYSVAQKDTSGFGSFFTGEKSYEYTLTPAGRKASSPDSQGLTMEFGGAAPDNTVYITLKDKWASFYQGQQLTFNVKIMRIPTSLQNLSPQELIDALKEKTFAITYPVSGQYQIQLFDKTLPGTYMVTLGYMRDGVNLEQLFTFAI